jgi:hypothetical protein
MEVAMKKLYAAMKEMSLDVVAIEGVERPSSN